MNGAKTAQPWLLPLMAVLLVAGAVGVWWWLKHSVPEQVPKDIELSKQAASRAGELEGQNRFREAQVAYRQAIAFAPEDHWRLHLGLAGTAAQISVENTTRAGISQPYSRSSVESVAAMRESLGEFDRAERLADTPQALAMVHAARAETYLRWGQMWQALGFFQAAARADTSDHARAERVAELVALMQHPENALTSGEGMRRTEALISTP
ncbi:MAG: hypothetical protein ABIU54_05390 [Candidatus Eisenbacteria bacterium]